jgi:hypothetical protein
MVYFIIFKTNAQHHVERLFYHSERMKFYYLKNNNSRYLGIGHNLSSTINSNLSE